MVMIDKLTVFTHKPSKHNTSPNQTINVLWLLQWQYVQFVH